MYAVLDILNWPEAGTMSFIALFLFLAVSFSVFLVFRLAAYRKKRRQENSDIILHHAYDRHVTGREIQRLRYFLELSADKDLENFRQSFANLRKPLLIFARQHPDKDSVRLYQKLAVDGLGSTMDGLKDIHRGEVGLTELNGKPFLFLITDIGEQLELVLPHSAPRISGNALRGYMYRPQSGGYLVTIALDKKLPAGHYLGQIVEVQEAEDRHRMAFMELEGRLRAYIPDARPEDEAGKDARGGVPLSGQPGSEAQPEPVGRPASEENRNPARHTAVRRAQEIAGTSPPAEPSMPHRGRPGEASAPPQKGRPPSGKPVEQEVIEFTVYLEKISDRAAVFGTDHNIMQYTRFHKLWELRLTLFDGTRFMSRGVFSPLPQGTHRYLFRFQETDPDLILALKQEIENNQPFPERMN